MKSRVSTACATLLALSAAAVEPQCAKAPTEVSTRQTFEAGDEGWIPYGPDAQLEITREPGQVKNGNAAMALRYDVKAGQYGSAVLPLEPGQLARLTRLHFWVKTDHATPVIVVLAEKQPGGGYYSAWFWCPQDQWLAVNLTPDDFSLNQGPDDPQDTDGRLDLADVQGIGLSDLGQAFQTLGSDPTYPLVVDDPSGPHRLLLDDFELVSSASNPPPRARASEIGDPNRGFVTWIALGGVDLQIAPPPNPLGEPAVRASYEQRLGRYVAISHGLANLDLHGVQTLSVRLASSHDARFMVYLEERRPGSHQGPRYSRLLGLRGGSQSTAVTLPLSDFQRDASSPVDPDGKLDAGELKSISFVDITAADARPPSQNTLWISSLAAH